MSDTAMQPFRSIYLAGFDIFRPDASAHGEQLKMLCNKYGYEGRYPLDKQVPRNLPPQERARWICRENLALLSECDLVMANLNPFQLVLGALKQFPDNCGRVPGNLVAVFFF